MSGEMAKVAMGYDDGMVERKSNIYDKEIIELCEKHIIKELKRMEQYIIKENNNINKNKNKNKEEEIKEKPYYINEPTHDLFLINRYGNYYFEITDIFISINAYILGDSKKYYFEYEIDGKQTQIGKIYKKIVNDILFFNLPDDVKLEKMRLKKLENILEDER